MVSAVAFYDKKTNRVWLKLVIQPADQPMLKLLRIMAALEFGETRNRGNVFGKSVIHDHYFIGAGSILMPNVIIGPNAIVGAGAVVTRNVSSGTVVAGVPARVIMPVEEYRQKALNKGMILENYIPAQRKK